MKEILKYDRMTGLLLLKIVVKRVINLQTTMAL